MPRLPQLVACFVETRVALREQDPTRTGEVNHPGPSPHLSSPNKEAGRGGQGVLACLRPANLQLRDFRPRCRRMPSRRCRSRERSGEGRGGLAAPPNARRVPANVSRGDRAWSADAAPAAAGPSRHQRRVQRTAQGDGTVDSAAVGRSSGTRASSGLENRLRADFPAPVERAETIPCSCEIIPCSVS